MVLRYQPASLAGRGRVDGSIGFYSANQRRNSV
jgi:hypothetical protein